MTDNCAKITVSADECRDIGIDYESFSPDNTTAQIFLASVLARLERIGIVCGRSEKITAEIFEQEDESLIIYVSGAGIIKDHSETPLREYETAVICRSHEDVIAAVKQLDKNTPAKLYKIGNKYALILKTMERKQISAIKIARIKEYGKLLSDTPVDQLFDL